MVTGVFREIDGAALEIPNFDIVFHVPTFWCFSSYRYSSLSGFEITHVQYTLLNLFQTVDASPSASFVSHYQNITLHTGINSGWPTLCFMLG